MQQRSTRHWSSSISSSASCPSRAPKHMYTSSSNMARRENGLRMTTALSSPSASAEDADEGVALARPRRREETDKGAVQRLGGEIAADEAPVGHVSRSQMF
ncbi:hypothetical protein BAE44_0018426 [Dichanthelium oligosanthes]|uniref:Uncharacterized protein n=1 Tax=Dichanthelium oligosanthes TaxID=888268 RepID=A0A1E5V697_9POAL|nr:hypothetical protein BAE44_0018426 [Dichanthelium oligosanthes]